MRLILPRDPAVLARQHRVLPVLVGGSVRVDLVLAGLPYEAEAIRRARAVMINGRRPDILSFYHRCFAELGQERRTGGN